MNAATNSSVKGRPTPAQVAAAADTFAPSTTAANATTQGQTAPRRAPRTHNTGPSWFSRFFEALFDLYEWVDSKTQWLLIISLAILAIVAPAWWLNSRGDFVNPLPAVPSLAVPTLNVESGPMNFHIPNGVVLDKHLGEEFTCLRVAAQGQRPNGKSWNDHKVLVLENQVVEEQATRDWLNPSVKTLNLPKIHYGNYNVAHMCSGSEGLEFCDTCTVDLTQTFFGDARCGGEPITVTKVVKEEFTINVQGVDHSHDAGASAVENLPLEPGELVPLFCEVR
ncbi:hypothetical protein F5Y16DRAFT_404583 [Xylariaceae sp. FL0255]|nr:hypothetical protein F5Y16DRAFT_404583 [Xylariaceae sp. FL0255]